MAVDKLRNGVYSCFTWTTETNESKDFVAAKAQFE